MSIIFRLTTAIDYRAHAHLIEKKPLRYVDRERGRFRTFLLTGLRNHLIDLRRKETASKRGGGQSPASLDETDEEGRPLVQPVDTETPDAQYDRDWAITLLNRVISRLESEYRAAGNASLFTHLQSFLYGDPDAERHTEAAKALGMTEDAVRAAGTRLRRRYQKLIGQETRETVTREEDVAEEFRHLFAALGGKHP